MYSVSRLICHVAQMVAEQSQDDRAVVQINVVVDVTPVSKDRVAIISGTCRPTVDEPSVACTVVCLISFCKQMVPKAHLSILWNQSCILA